jgi:hypothetical protein
MRPVTLQTKNGHMPLEVRSPRELFRQTSAVVFDLAPRWGAVDDSAAIVVTSPLLTRADVQSAFDEISEKYHVAGITLRFNQQDGGPLKAIFEPSNPGRPDLSGCGAGISASPAGGPYGVS